MESWLIKSNSGIFNGAPPAIKHSWEIPCKWACQWETHPHIWEVSIATFDYRRVMEFNE